MNIVTLAGGMMLASCAGSSPVQPGPVTTAPADGFNQDGYSATVPRDYLLRPRDIISVVVFRESDISLPSVRIAADGSISVPLIGRVQAAGRSPVEIGEDIRQRLDARFVRNPSVAVNVIDYAPLEVTVEGSVGTPGVYQFTPGTRLSGGIALAEGLEREADARDVVIFREGAEGIEIARFDYAAVRAGTMMDPVLEPGDRIVVGTNNLSQFWQDVLRALPAFAIFTRL